ncbi:MAG: hypothetical protein GKS05_04360 [Nitrospirales bacterium]|nr:hypothetical protein [Nitrospirales bacterium]
MNAQSQKSFNFHGSRTSKFLVIALAIVASMLLPGQPAWSSENSHNVIIDLSMVEWKTWEGLPQGAEIAIF